MAPTSPVFFRAAAPLRAAVCFAALGVLQTVASPFTPKVADADVPAEVAPGLEFSTWVSLKTGDQLGFELIDAQGTRTTLWARVGDRVAGFRIEGVETDPVPSVRLSDAEGQEHRLELRDAVIKPSEETEEQAFLRHRFPVAYILSQRILADQAREAAGMQSGVDAPSQPKETGAP